MTQKITNLVFVDGVMMTVKGTRAETRASFAEPAFFITFDSWDYRGDKWITVDVVKDKLLMIAGDDDMPEPKGKTVLVTPVVETVGRAEL